MGYINQRGLAIVWLLVLAIVILLITAVQISCYVEYLKMGRLNYPLLFSNYGSLLICGNIVFFLAGITMLFVATDWRWALGGVGIYWFLVVFVLMPIKVRRLMPNIMQWLLLFYGLRE